MTNVLKAVATITYAYRVQLVREVENRLFELAANAGGEFLSSGAGGGERTLEFAFPTEQEARAFREAVALHEAELLDARGAAIPGGFEVQVEPAHVTRVVRQETDR